MVRIVALHAPPADADAYWRHYLEVHMPIVQRIPGVRNIRLGRVAQTADGGAAPYHLVSEVWFDDRASLDAALNTPEMAAALADVPNFASAGVTIMFCDSEDFAPTLPPAA